MRLLLLLYEIQKNYNLFFEEITSELLKGIGYNTIINSNNSNNNNNNNNNNSNNNINNSNRGQEQQNRRQDYRQRKEESLSTG